MRLMTAASLKFGYLPEALDVRVGKLVISSLPDLQETVRDISDYTTVEGNWLYAPPQRIRSLGGQARTAPYPSRVFGLPKTHLIVHDDQSSAGHLTFHLWSLSFFYGMRFTSLPAGYLDATPIKPEKLNDFLLLGRSLERSIELAETFWQVHHVKSKAASLFASAVHSMFLSHYPRLLEFERFVYCYTALDACFALARTVHGLQSATHADRPAAMCDLFGIPKPDWADKSKTPQNALVATLRNDTLHEALFMDQPLGFATMKPGLEQNLTLQMQALICRLLVALIGGGSADYVKTPVNTRQRQALHL